MVLFTRSADDVATGQEALQAGQKTYLALVRGSAGVIPELVERPLRPPGRQEPVEARTHFQVLGRSAVAPCTLVCARPRTGRFHQIRRHLAGVGSPILLDSKHGDTRIHPAWRERGLTRLFLHLARLELPLLGIDAAAPLPDDLASVLSGVSLTVPAGVYDGPPST